MGIKNLESSGNNEWETPDDVFQHWHRIFGFDLDVCAAPDNKKLDNFLSKEEDCFLMPWRRRNWMNPPYGKPEAACKPIGCTKKKCLPAPEGRGHCITQYEPGLSDFVKRAYEQSLEGCLVVALIPVSTATEWWQSYVIKAHHIYYYPHRINFLRNGVVVKGVAFDPCIVIWGLNPK